MKQKSAEFYYHLKKLRKYYKSVKNELVYI